MSEWQTENLVPFGRYFLGARIATGGMGEVYLGKMKGAAGFEKRVVIKKILPQLSRDPEFVKRFIDEGKLAVKLTHANIVPVLDLGEVDGDYFLAMEFVDGADLRQILRQLASEDRSLPLDLAVFVLVEVCRGLHYAHRRTDDAGRPLHVIHRDISPANVMVSRDGAVRLVDFGIAKAADRLAHSVTGALQGKFVYMSPEQARGDELDHRSDIFSLGSVAYELLTGVRPFEGRTDLQTLDKVKQADPAPIQEVRPEIPDPIAAAVHICLARDPDDRFHDVDQLQRVLQDHLFELPSPPDEKELGAFVRDLIGARPTPAATSARSLDALLSDELDRAARGSKSGVEATSTATAEAVVPPSPSGSGVYTTGEIPVAGGTATTTQPGLGTSNRILIGGLLAIIAVLLYFNIRNLVTDRPTDEPAGGPPVATVDTRAAVTPVAAPDTRGAGGPAALRDGDVREAGDVHEAGDVRGDGEGASVVARPTPLDAGAVEETAVEPAERVVLLQGLEDGDAVEVNGVAVSPDAAGRVPLPSGEEARVTVERPHHARFEHTVPPEAEEPAPIAVSPRPLRRTIVVRTRPEGAALSFDGRDAGEAPQRVSVSYGRSVRVEARHPGHRDARETLRYGSPSSVTITLEPRPTGRLTFRFHPASAAVFIDGKKLDTGATNIVNLALPAGRHRLLIRAPDGTEKRIPFKVEAGLTSNLKTIRLDAP